MKARALVAVFVSASSCLAQQFSTQWPMSGTTECRGANTVARYRSIFEGYSGTPSVPHGTSQNRAIS
jgi:hypothetical protein